MGINHESEGLKNIKNKSIPGIEEYPRSEIWTCIRKREHLICYDCEEFPCSLYSWFVNNCPERLDDYDYYKKVGLEEWKRDHESGRLLAGSTNK